MEDIILFARFACHHQGDWSQVSSPFWVSCVSWLAMILVQLFYVSSLSSRWFLCWIPMELPGAPRAPRAIWRCLMFDVGGVFLCFLCTVWCMQSYMGLIHFQSWLAKYVYAACIQKQLGKCRPFEQIFEFTSCWTNVHFMLKGLPLIFNPFDSICPHVFSSIVFIVQGPHSSQHRRLGPQPMLWRCQSRRAWRTAMAMGLGQKLGAPKWLRWDTGY